MARITPLVTSLLLLLSFVLVHVESKAAKNTGGLFASAKAFKAKVNGNVNGNVGKKGVSKKKIVKKRKINAASQNGKKNVLDGNIGKGFAITGASLSAAALSGVVLEFRPKKSSLNVKENTFLVYALAIYVAFSIVFMAYFIRQFDTLQYVSKYGG